MPRFWMSSVTAAALILAAPAAFAQSAGTNAPEAQHEGRHAVGNEAKTKTLRTPEHHAMEHSGKAMHSAQSERMNKGEMSQGKAETKNKSGLKNSGSLANESQHGRATAAEHAKQHQSLHQNAELQNAEHGKTAGNTANPSAQPGSHTAKAQPNAKNATAQKNRAQQSAENKSQQRNSGTSPSNANANNANNANMAAAGQNGAPQLDPAKRQRIRHIVNEKHVTNISNADFNVAVGTVVPDRYEFYPLPDEIVSMLPEYRGYDYVVADNEIVIISPQTRRIVYTLPESRSAELNTRSSGCR